jgi:uncharacterized protein involved in exopolysaccharide biosynthesis/Mrp family chromosome partitioning ATPase
MTTGNMTIGTSLGDAVYRHKALVALFILAGAAAGVVAYMVSPRQYVAETIVALNARRAEILPTQSVVAPQMPDIPELRTELDAISSRTMTTRVLQRLGAVPPGALPKDSGNSALLAVANWFRSTGPGSKPKGTRDADHEDVTDRVLDGLKVSNDGRSYTIHIAYAASSPDFAAKAAQAYADEYLSQRSNLVAAVAREASKWLGGNLAALRAKVQSSETAVEEYRRRTGLLGENGTQLLADRIAELNRELVATQSALAVSEAKLDTATRLQRGDFDGTAFPEALSSPTIQELIKQETEALQPLRQLEQARAFRSPQIPGLQAHLALIHQRIESETARVIASMRSEVATTKGKEGQLELALADTNRRLGDAGAATVHLKQLESEAKANRAVYESFLNRYKQTIEQVNFQSPDARLLSSAAVPTAPATPRLPTLLAIGIIGGCTAGTTLALWLNRKDAAVRLVAEIEELVHLPVLAAITYSPRALGRVGPRSLANRESEKALSRLAAILQFHRQTQRAAVFAITSSTPREGKTSFSVALARQIAANGRKIAVVDTNAPARSGIAAGSNSPVAESWISTAIAADDASAAHFVHAGELILKQGTLRGDLLKKLLAELRQRYDVVMFDAPALSEGAEAIQFSAASDAVLLLARLGVVKRPALLDGLRQLALCGVPVTGVVALGSRREALPPPRAPRPPMIAVEEGVVAAAPGSALVVAMPPPDHDFRNA